MNIDYLEIGGRRTKPGNSTVSVQAHIRAANVMPEPKQFFARGLPA